MTNQEFATWLESHLYNAMPSVRKWFAQEVAEPLQTQKLWREALADCTLEECASVVRRWVTGLLEAPKAYDRDTIAARVRLTIEAERKTRTAPRSPKALEEFQSHKPSDASAVAPILAEAMRLRGSGASHSEIAAMVDAKIPSGDPHEGPRTDCPLCRDRGVVEVWRVDVARSVDAGKIELSDAAGSYNVACSCGAGNHHAMAAQSWQPMPRYSKHEHCLYHSGALDDERSNLLEWLNGREESRKHGEFTQFERPLEGVGEPAASP